MSQTSAAKPRRIQAQRWLVILTTLLAVALISPLLLPGWQQQDEDRVAAVIDAYCVDCHNRTDWDGGFAFEHNAAEIRIIAAGREEGEAAIWERAARKVRAGLMPPANAARPDRETVDTFAAVLEAQLDRRYRDDPDPGAEPLSRLNRAEYRNSIRDMLAFDAAAIVDTLPVDEEVAGFDNIGDGLSVSPTLIEAYVAAAMTIARQAVGDRSAVATQVRYEPASRLSQDQHIDGLPLATRGGFEFTHNYPLDASYEIRIAGAVRSGIAAQTLCPPPSIVVALNGDLLDVADPSQFRMVVPAGPQTLAVALIDDSRCSGVNELHDVYAASGAIRNVEIHGPFDASGPGDTPSRRAIFSCHPARGDDDSDCAIEILTRLASTAFRQPLAADAVELDSVLEFYRQAAASGGFEHGVEQAIARILMSPAFVFQFEREPEALAPAQNYRLGPLEIASRLSFFLWSSLPDSELVEEAAGGTLGTESELRRQVERMLSDARSLALVDNFAGQWLSLRELREALPQDPSFDANLRQALELETSLLVREIIENDKSVLELLQADYSFLNERLARHYGIEGVRGSHMRRVQLAADNPRRGLLGHGSWLTATSVADRTSPVIRGEWYVTHLLGAPVPEPPPGVEADLSDEAEVARDGDTLRERLERHRANPNCAACHQIMDPIGLALENFDLIGRWRDTDQGRTIDTAATLIDGTQVESLDDLRESLLSRSELFVTSLTEKLLSYALGRIIDHRDMPAVRKIVRAAAADGYKFSELVNGVVLSDPFLMRRKSLPANETVASVEDR
jgi:mono/diheme cytochrome c family protein